MDQSFYSPGGTATVPAAPLPRRLPPLVEQGLPSGFRITDSTPRLRTEDLRTPSGDPMVGSDGFLIPPARSMAMVVGAATRVFSYRFDEAMRDNAVNARAMRRDAFIRGLLEERLLPTINRKWHLVVEDESDPDQKAVRDDLSRIVRATPQFDAFKRALLDGVWFGRAGCQWNNQRNDDVDGYWCINKWDPVHGDSVQFTFDGTPAILMDGQTAGWYSQHGASWGLNGDLRPTDRGGTALVLHRPYWRDRFAIHQHIREKADFFEGELAGSVQGLGLRGLVYWHYVIRTEVLTWMLTYMQAVGSMDLMVFNFPQGDNEAKLNAEANARKIIGKAALVCPRNPQGTWPAVEQIPMNESGLEALHKLLADYFDRHIERLVVGQSMSAGDDNESGLGGTGRADFAKATKDEILVYDTNRLDETISSDVVAPLKRYNFPWARFPVRYASILPDLDAKDKTANGKTMVDAGVEIKVDEWREAAGFSRPEEGDETVGGRQPGTPPPGTPPPDGGTVPNGPGPMGGAKPPGGPPAAAQTYPRHQPAPEPEGPPKTPQNRPPAPPTPNDAGSVAPAVGTTPTMGYPGGGNAYIPSFGDTEDERRRPRPMGFTRYAAHAPAGGVTMAGKKFIGGQFIPAEVMADASPEERAAVESGDARGKPLPSDGGAKLPTGGNRILDAIKSIPARAMASVRDKVKSAYAKLEARYGPRYAKAIVAAGLSGLPIPLPGAMAVAAAPVLALAELHHQLRGISAPIHAAADDWTQTPEFAAAVREFRKDCGVAEPARNERGTGPVQYGKFGCLTVPLTGNAAIQILNRAALVRDGDLASDGREDTPHITVR